MKIKTVLTKALNGVAGMSFIVMVALTCWQVFTRYGINRYMLGCKSFDTRAWKCQAYRINRYMLGCKYLQQ